MEEIEQPLTMLPFFVGFMVFSFSIVVSLITALMASWQITPKGDFEPSSGDLRINMDNIAFVIPMFFGSLISAAAIGFIVHSWTT